jgi:hypothetical protein
MSFETHPISSRSMLDNCGSALCFAAITAHKVGDDGYLSSDIHSIEKIVEEVSANTFLPNSEFHSSDAHANAQFVS